MSNDGALLKELQGSKVTEGLMRTDRIVSFLPLDELWIKSLDGLGAVVDFVELLSVGSVGSFHGSVELGTFRW